MSEPSLTYSVRDRSILLPFYKRFVVEPSLGLVPRRVDPNAITHVGHLVNLAGAVALAIGVSRGVKSGWLFAVAAITLQLYNWCDNADGAHARRTGQCSAMGELLDHGLDLLNVAYIAAMTAMAVGADATWTTAVMILVPGAAAATYWEQAETGVFELGLLNQVESVTILSAALVASALLGTDVWGAVHVGPLTLRTLALVVVVAGTAASILLTTARVARKGGRLLPVAPAFALGGLGFAALRVGAAPASAVIAVVTGGLVFFGLRNLTLRVHGKKPVVERGVALVAASAGAVAAIALGGHALGPTPIAALAIAGALFFGAYTVGNAAASRKKVRALDAARARA